MYRLCSRAVLKRPGDFKSIAANKSKKNQICPYGVRLFPYVGNIRDLRSYGRNYFH
jgi:hypothetical protein